MNRLDLQREFKTYAIAERGLRPQTLRETLRVLDRLCAYAASQNLRALTHELVKSFLVDGRLNLGWSPKTFRVYWQYLKTFFDWCVAKQYLKENPAVGIKKPKLPQRLPRCLSHEDARKILAETVLISWNNYWIGKRNLGIVATFLMAGLRLQELLDLRCEDVDLHTSELWVRCGKGQKDRHLPMHPQLVRILKEFREDPKTKAKGSPWFFPSSRSTLKLRTRDIRVIFERITKASGVKFTPHMLRHTFAREMLDSGLDIYKLKELLGHNHLSTTQIYASISRRKLREQLERLNIY